MTTATAIRQPLQMTQGYTPSSPRSGDAYVFQDSDGRARIARFQFQFISESRGNDFGVVKGQRGNVIQIIGELQHGHFEPVQSDVRVVPKSFFDNAAWSRAHTTDVLWQ